MATEAAKLFAEVGAETTQYERKMRQVGQTFDSTAKGMQRQADQIAGAISGGLSGIAGALGVGGALMLGKQVVGMGWDMAQAGMQVQALERNFVALSGEGVENLDRLRQATRGLVSDSDLLQATNKYLAMGLASNSQEAGKLIDTFSQLAIVLGRDVNGALQEAAQMLANQSTMRLDQFGMSASRVEARIKALQAANADMSKEQAFTAAVLEQAEITLKKVGDQAGTGISKVANLQASWSNMRAELGRTIEATVALKVVSDFVERGAEGLRAEREAADIVAPFKEIQARRTAQYMGYTEEAYMREKEAIRQAEVALQSKAITEEQAIAFLKEKLGLVEEDLRLSDLSAEAAKREHDEIRESIYLEQQLTDALNEQYGARIQNMRAQNAYASRYTAQAEAMGLTPMSMEDYDADKKAKAREAEQAAKAYASAWKSEMNRQQKEFRSLVEGVLQPTRVTDLDMARTRLGDYAGNEKWDEYVRRLRSAATDAKSAWKSLVPTDVLAQGGDALKVWAAETEEAFYAGQMPEMVNWDAVMADIEKQVRYQAGREALINEAISRAQAAGIGANVGQIREALGVGQTYSEIGQDVASGMTAGMGGVNIAAQVTTSFEADLKKQQERYVTQGQLMVSWLATGVKDGTPALAGDLALALFPALQRLFANVGPRP